MQTYFYLNNLENPTISETFFVLYTFYKYIIINI